MADEQGTEVVKDVMEGADKTAITSQTPEEKAIADKAAADKVEADKAAATPEAKAAAEKAAADKKVADDKAAADKKAADDKAKGAPEKYEDFKVPDGMALDKEAIAEFVPLAKELNLSQANAQKIVDLYAKKIKGTVEGNAAEYKKMVNDWLDEAKKDPDIGGQKYDESLRLAKRGLAKYGGPKLSTVIDYTGVGNHPEFIRAWANVGKDVKEDDILPGGGGSQSSKQSVAANLGYT